MNGLRECPFCGNEQLDMLPPQPFDGVTKVFCAQCDCSGPPAFNSERMAAEAWNRRADDLINITPKGLAMLGEDAE